MEFVATFNVHQMTLKLHEIWCTTNLYDQQHVHNFFLLIIYIFWLDLENIIKIVNYNHGQWIRTLTETYID